MARSVQDGIYWKLPFIAPIALYAGLVAVAFRNRKRSGGGTAAAP
jgi:hypothetical protein